MTGPGAVEWDVECANCGTFCKCCADKAECLPKKNPSQKPTSSYRLQQRRQLRRQSAPTSPDCRHQKRPESAAICHLKIKFHLIYEGHFEWPPVSVEASSQGDYNETRMQFIIMQSSRGLSATALSPLPTLFLLPIFLLGLFPNSLFT